MGKQIHQQPDLTLVELQRQLQAAKGLRLSIGRLWLALQQKGLRLKRSHSTPGNKKPGKLTGADKCGAKQ